MTLRPALLSAIAALSLAACGGSGGDAADSAPPAQASPAAEAPAESAPPAAGQPAVVLTSEGLRLPSAGEPRAVTFGESREVVVADIGGEPAESQNPDCPTGATVDLRWPNGLQIITQNGEFVGWKVEQGSLATASGVRVGSTRAQAQAAPGFALTPNNFELVMFSVDDGVTGVLASAEPTATVTQLYAGNVCMAD